MEPIVRYKKAPRKRVQEANSDKKFSSALLVEIRQIKAKIRSAGSVSYSLGRKPGSTKYAFIAATKIPEDVLKKFLQFKVKIRDIGIIRDSPPENKPPKRVFRASRSSSLELLKEIQWLESKIRKIGIIRDTLPPEPKPTKSPLEEEEQP